MPSPVTFPELIARRLRENPGQPLFTAYDDATGERVELSGTTYANWVAKTANLFLEELDLDTGDRVRIDLPAHWLSGVFLGAAWTAGLSVSDGDAELVVGGPELADADAEPGGPVLLACSLRPMAVRFAETLPAHVHDYGLLWPGQPDIYLGTVPVGAADQAWAGGPTQGELLEEARAAGRAPGVRLLTDVAPQAGQGVPAFLSALVAGGSVVLSCNTPADRWPARYESERATEELRVSA